MEWFNIRKSIKVYYLNRLKKTNPLNQHNRFRKKIFAKIQYSYNWICKMECIVNNVKELLLNFFDNGITVIFIF